MFSRQNFFSANIISPKVQAAKCVFSAATNTAAETFLKLCHVVREGERKQPLFALSKMAEGREKAAMSREEERCSPSCTRVGWAIQRASLPRFPLLTRALCPVSRLSHRTNGVQLCCRSIGNSFRATVGRGKLQL